MNLFQSGDFTLASGQPSTFKIECDALSDDDWWSITKLIAKHYSFSEVHGVPRGGNRLAAMLEPYCKPQHGVSKSLIVDDVYTTGNSIQNFRKQLMLRRDGFRHYYYGVVLFARGPIHKIDKDWVIPMFQMGQVWGQS